MGDPETPKPPRKRFVILLAAFAVELVVLAFLAESYERIFVQMEIRELPLPTEAWIALAGFLRTLPGILGLMVVVVAAGVLALRGMFDPALKKLQLLMLLGLLGMPGFFGLSLHLPIVKIRQNLAK